MYGRNDEPKWKVPICHEDMKRKLNFKNVLKEVKSWIYYFLRGAGGGGVGCAVVSDVDCGLRGRRFESASHATEPDQLDLSPVVHDWVIYYVLGILCPALSVWLGIYKIPCHCLVLYEYGVLWSRYHRDDHHLVMSVDVAGAVSNDTNVCYFFKWRSIKIVWWDRSKIRMSAFFHSGLGQVRKPVWSN